MDQAPPPDAVVAAPAPAPAVGPGWASPPRLHGGFSYSTAHHRAVAAGVVLSPEGTSFASRVLPITAATQAGVGLVGQPQSQGLDLAALLSPQPAAAEGSVKQLTATPDAAMKDGHASATDGSDADVPAVLSPNVTLRAKRR